MAEIERRWIVQGIDPDIQRSPSQRFEQGYLVTSGEGAISVRIVDGTSATLRPKFGRGIERDDSLEGPLDLTHARTLLKYACPDTLVKVRYIRDGWEVDFFEGPLKGLVIVERELASRDEEVELPEWITHADEVTDSVTNQHLARLATDLSTSEPAMPVRKYIQPRVPCIVLTGGPCAGKSTIMRMLRDEMGDRLHCVPEVASILIQELQINPIGGLHMTDLAHLHKFQRTLYRVQRSFEEISSSQARIDGKRALLMDRGTIDAAAYLKGVEQFELVCGTKSSYEFDLYHLVICLETPDRETYLAHMGDNAARSEAYPEARILSDRTRDAWAGHPNRIVIPAGPWDQKVARVREAVQKALR
jgi:CYTH domain-containing protein/predicted ATPase